MDLAPVFLQHAGGAGARFAGRANLASQLAALVDEARGAWPGVQLSAELFVGHVAAKLAGAPEPLSALDNLQGPDLYLALACLKGDAAALTFFEKQFLTEATAQVSRREKDRAFVQELAQRLRVSLFVERPASPPKMVSYTGQGPLGVWLRTVTSRLAVDLRREEMRQPFGDDGRDDIRSPGLDPEMDYLRTVYRTDLREAFRATLSSLSLPEANILRLHFLEGAGVAALAAFNRTSLRTMGRRIAKVRETVIHETRRRLVGRLNVPQSQINTIMAMMQSQVQSVAREFFEAPPEAKKDE